MIGLDTKDIDNWVNAHGAGKMEFDGVGSDQLRDSIGTEPSLREFLGSMRKMEIVS